MGPISEDRLAEAFDLLDYCDAGYITAESLSSMLGEELPRDDVDDIIREAAPDNNGKVSFQEFLALWEDPDEINEYEIIRGIIIGDSERSANVSGMSSEEETERGTRGSSPMKPVVKRTLSAEGQKRVMFSE